MLTQKRQKLSDCWKYLKRTNGLFEIHFALLGKWMRAGGFSQEKWHKAAHNLDSFQQKNNTGSHINIDQTLSE